MIEVLASGKRPAVNVTINGRYTFRNTVAVMGGLYMIGISAEHRKGADVASGDMIDVDLELDSTPRQVTVPPDFAEALDVDEEAKRTFDKLSYSNKQRHVLSIEGTNNPETRKRRIAKAISTLREGSTNSASRASQAAPPKSRSEHPKPEPLERTVDAYIAAWPPAVQKTLTALRNAIKAAAPGADEVISYQMPTYKYHGPLVSFAAYKGHCALYGVGGTRLEALRDDLKLYDTTKTKSTIRFPIDKPLPAALVNKIIKARMAENKEGAKKSPQPRLR